MTQPSQGPSSEGLAPLGGPDEPETPTHTADPDAATGPALEDAPAYRLAVEDGAPLAPDGEDPGAGPLAPEFRAPGEG